MLLLLYSERSSELLGFPIEAAPVWSHVDEGIFHLHISGITMYFSPSNFTALIYFPCNFLHVICMQVWPSLQNFMVVHLVKNALEILYFLYPANQNQNIWIKIMEWIDDLRSIRSIIPKNQLS